MGALVATIFVACGKNEDNNGAGAPAAPQIAQCPGQVLTDIGCLNQDMACVAENPNMPGAIFGRNPADNRCYPQAGYRPPQAAPGSSLRGFVDSISNQKVYQDMLYETSQGNLCTNNSSFWNWGFGGYSCDSWDNRAEFTLTGNNITSPNQQELLDVTWMAIPDHLGNGNQNTFMPMGGFFSIPFQMIYFMLSDGGFALQQQTATVVSVPVLRIESGSGQPLGSAATNPISVNVFYKNQLFGRGTLGIANGYVVQPHW